MIYYTTLIIYYHIILYTILYGRSGGASRGNERARGNMCVACRSAYEIFATIPRVTSRQR